MPFVTQLASMHPWGSCNRLSSGGGSGGGGRSKKNEIQGKSIKTLRKNFLFPFSLLGFC